MSFFFGNIDDKHVPLYRVLWIADVPHFCGHEDCEREGQYEVRLDQGESLWAKYEERNHMLTALEKWQAGPPEEDWPEDSSK